MAEYITVLKVSSQPPKQWEGKYGPMETYKIMVEGQDEPVEINRKPGNAPRVSEALYGEITNTEYGLKFSPEQKPYNGPSSTPKKEWKSDEEFYGNKNAEIKAQWSIGQAIQLLIPTINNPSEVEAEAQIERWAVKFYAMVDRVKDSTQPEAPKEPEQPGLSQARSKAAELRAKTLDEELSANMDAAMANDPEPIDLSEIPF